MGRWALRRVRGSAALVGVLAVAGGLSLGVTGQTRPMSKTPAAVTVTPDRVDAVYRRGETVRWTISAPGRGKPVLKLSAPGRSSVEIEASPGATAGTWIAEATLTAPGTVLLEVSARRNDADAADNALGGAICEPENIRANPVSEVRWAEFERFWDAKVRELDATAMNPIVSEVPERGDASVRYERVTLSNIRGTHVYGQLARPRGGEKFPALLIVQWAGVYPLVPGWVTQRAKEGWLALNISAHDVPFDLPEAEFKRLGETTLKDYLFQGMEDPERCYFLRVYLGCRRAAEYLASRPEWDGKTLVVMGVSQGGQQAIVTAALYPKVTAALALVPAGCDVDGGNEGRPTGFPYWQVRADAYPELREKILSTAGYYDVSRFARRVGCATLVGTGAIDRTCPPGGVIAMYNELGRGPVAATERGLNAPSDGAPAAGSATRPSQQPSPDQPTGLPNPRRVLLVSGTGGHQGPNPQWDRESVRWLTALRETGRPPAD